MKKIILLCLFICNILFAQSTVWKVEKNNNTIYIGGTIHLLRDSDYPLPVEYNKAYKLSSKIYFETDLSAFNQPDIQKKMFSKMLLEDNKTLKSILNKETYTKLAHFCHAHNMHLKQLEHFKPSFIALILTVSELKNIGVRQEGVDKYFELQALNDAKKIGKLESVDEQIKYITSIGLGNENSFVNHSLDDLKKIKTLFEDLIIAWKKGDDKKMYELFIKDVKKNYPTVYNKLLVERNNNWMPIIENMFNTNETEFVLVGAAHLVGKEGVIEQLRSKGYKVEKFK